MKRNQKTRLALYFLGLFIMTAGIAVSVKSNLGVSPVSSIPYTLTCVWGIEMGKATILFHGVLVLLQICILRRRFQVKNLLQIPLGIVFGYFTTFCNFLVSFAPTPQNLVVWLGCVGIGTVLVGVVLGWITRHFSGWRDALMEEINTAHSKQAPSHTH